MNPKVSFGKYLFVCGLGFGLGGLLWGLILYLELPDLEFPFQYGTIIIMAIFGGTSLVWPFKEIKQILKSILAGFLGWGSGALVGAIFSYYLFLYGVFSLDILLPNFIDEQLIELAPGLPVGGMWLVFLAVSIFVAFFYSFILRFRAKPLIARGAIGLGLGSLIGPITGNLLGNLFNSVLASYLMAFFIICFVFGWFLGSAVYKSIK